MWEVHPSLTPDDDTRISFSIALKNQNLDWLKAEALAVSDPSSSSYGRSYSIASIAQRIAPSPSTLAAVRQWLESIHPTSQIELGQSQDVFFVEAPVSAVASTFRTKFSFWRHRASDRLLLRTADLPETYLLHLPSHIRSAIDVILGIHDFFSYPSEKKLSARQTANKRSSFAPSSNAPDILPPLASGSSTVSVSLVVYCKNGMRTQNATLPCSDYPPAASSIAVHLENTGDVWSKTFQFSPIDNCKAAPSVDGVVCTLAETSIPANRRVSVAAEVKFADGSFSSRGDFVTDFSPSDWTTPRLIHDLYGIPSNIRGRNPKNSQCVVAFEEQYISLKDLNEFYDLVGINRNQQHVTIIGPNDESQPGGESTLDIQSITSVAPGVKTTFWSFGGNVKAQGGYILEFFIALNNDTNAPLVSSISYGDTELGYYNNYGSWNYINRCETELQKLALRRRTIVSGAGDAGVSNVGEDGNDLSPTDPSCTPFRPFYPADSPWVLGVGATFLSSEALPICRQQQVFSQPVLCSQTGEIVVSVSDGLFWTTGGGFSSYFARYAYQNTSVNTFLEDNANNLPPSSFWNITGQAYPDISAIGHNFLMVMGGVLQPVDGTSMSSPVSAGIISLLNDHVLNAGGAPLGFINPLLYSLSQTNPEAFNDVVVGSNADGDWQVRGSPYDIKCKYGFQAAPGYDPASGVGTWNYPNLVDLLPIVPPSEI